MVQNRDDKIIKNVLRIELLIIIVCFFDYAWQKFKMSRNKIFGTKYSLEPEYAPGLVFLLFGLISLVSGRRDGFPTPRNLDSTENPGTTGQKYRLKVLLNIVIFFLSFVNPTDFGLQAVCLSHGK